MIHAPQMSPPPEAYARTTTGDAELPRSGNGFGSAAQCGLASLMIGCTLLVMAAILMIFALELFQHGGDGNRTFNLALAIVFAIASLVTVAGLGVVGIVCGHLGWRQAAVEHSSVVLPMTGVLASSIGFTVWLCAGLHLLAILFSLA
jgi:hypothetical protein